MGGGERVVLLTVVVLESLCVYLRRWCFRFQMSLGVDKTQFVVGPEMARASVPFPGWLNSGEPNAVGA